MDCRRHSPRYSGTRFHPLSRDRLLASDLVSSVPRNSQHRRRRAVAVPWFALARSYHRCWPPRRFNPTHAARRGGTSFDARSPNKTSREKNNSEASVRATFHSAASFSETRLTMEREVEKGFPWCYEVLGKLSSTIVPKDA